MPGPQANELWDGRYRLERRLGAGGMASVWLAHDDRLGREVAVKVLSDVLAGDREYIARFEREARVAAGLNHANLVTIFDFAVAEERPYLVMELVSGGTVADWIQGGGFRAADVERLADELLVALEHIHAAGVIHRDLKPANVLIDHHDRFRLTDFGIAQPSDATALTQTGDVIGTMKYMAPEVRAGHRATVRSDLYSLGVLLRDCGGERVAALAPLLAALAHDDPADRPASAREAAALVGVAEAPTRRLPATAQRRSRRPLMFAAAGLLTVAAVAIALALGGGDEDATVGGGETAPATTSADEPPPAPTPAPVEQPKPEPKPEPPPKTQPETTAPTCDELEEIKKSLDEQRKEAEKAAGPDKEAREAIKERFEPQKQAIEEQKKDCVK
jgi:eukaryotic-like serine/threonine-protein kinase